MSAIRSMETTHQTQLVLRCKTIIVGDPATGKTATTQMFHSNGHNFPKNYIMTTGVDFCVKPVKIPDTNAVVELYIHDCGGQSIFNQREFGTVHFENACMLLLVYDVSKRESFKSCAKWFQEVNNISKDITGVLLATKTDLRESDKDAITIEEGKELAEEYNLKHFECSALRGDQIDAPFNYVAHAFYRKYEEAIKLAEQSR